MNIIILFTVLFLFGGKCAALSVAEEAQIRADLWALFRANSDPNSYLPAKAIRLAFHDAVTFRVADGTGGPHAVFNSRCPAGTSCENNYAVNRGLQFAVDLLAPVQAKYSAVISVADFWALAGAVAVDFSALPANNRGAITPLSASVVRFRFGRTDRDFSFSSPESRFPDAEAGYASIRSVFAGIGLTANEMVALIGAHSVGRLNPQNSGYEGAWDNDPTVLNSNYFGQILRKWTFNKVPNPLSAGSTLSIWKTAAPGTPVSGQATSMTNADMSLVITDSNAKAQNFVFDPANPGATRNAETFAIVQGFSNNNALFLSTFGAAFTRLTESGYTNLRDLTTATTTTTTTTPTTTTTTTTTVTSTPAPVVVLARVTGTAPNARVAQASAVLTTTLLQVLGPTWAINTPLASSPGNNPNSTTLTIVYRKTTTTRLRTLQASTNAEVQAALASATVATAATNAGLTNLVAVDATGTTTTNTGTTTTTTGAFLPSSSSGSGSGSGAAIGGAIGGVLGALALIGAVLAFLKYKKSNAQDTTEKGRPSSPRRRRSNSFDSNASDSIASMNSDSYI